MQEKKLHFVITDIAEKTEKNMKNFVEVPMIRNFLGL